MLTATRTSIYVAAVIRIVIQWPLITKVSQIRKSINAWKTMSVWVVVKREINVLVKVLSQLSDLLN